MSSTGRFQMKRPVSQDAAVAGGPEPDAGADEAGWAAVGSRCAERAGANSVTRWSDFPNDLPMGISTQRLKGADIRERGQVAILVGLQNPTGCATRCTVAWNGSPCPVNARAFF